MRLIWLSMECPYPANSGGRNVVWNKICKMSEKHEIYFFSIIDSPSEFQYKAEIMKFSKEVKLYERAKNFRTLLKSIFYPYPAVTRWILEMKKDIDVCCKRIEPDYIIVEFPQMMGNLSKETIKQYKIVLSQHNTEFMAMRDIAFGIKSLPKKIALHIVSKQLERYEEKIYKNVDMSLNIFVSLKDKAFFEKKYELTNTLLVPIGANIEACSNGCKNKNVIFVAKMSYTPNDIAARWFLDCVWEQVHQKVPEASLYLVGKDPSEELIDKAVKNKSVIVTGVVDDVNAYYDLAAVVVVPILNGGGVKVKLMEALGHGKLVITTVKGLEGTDFIPGVHVMAADNSISFADLCVDALNCPEKYNFIKENAIEKIKAEYSWDGIIDRFETKLMKMLEI